MNEVSLFSFKLLTKYKTTIYHSYTANDGVLSRTGRYAIIGCKLKQNANEGCNSCACLAGLVLRLIACFYFTCDHSFNQCKISPWETSVTVTHGPCNTISSSTKRWLIKSRQQGIGPPSGIYPPSVWQSITARIATSGQNRS